MKLTLAVCVALLSVVSLQAEDEMGSPILPEGTRIVDGIPAVPGQLPYMAAILASGEKWSHYAAGSLITRHAVLTAARFTEECTTYNIRLGSIYLSGSDPNAWTVNSTWLLVHPNFNKTTLENDAAIIFLPSKAPLTDYIDLVPLPSSPTIASFIGSRAIVSGWGHAEPGSNMSEVLSWAEVVVIPNEICKQFFVGDNATITGRSLCAGSTNTTAFHGEFGAPLVLRNGGKYMQIGLFSVPPGGYYNSSKPASYIRITSILDWITSKTGLDY